MLLFVFSLFLFDFAFCIFPSCDSCEFLFNSIRLLLQFAISMISGVLIIAKLCSQPGIMQFLTRFHSICGIEVGIAFNRRSQRIFLCCIAVANFFPSFLLVPRQPGALVTYRFSCFVGGDFSSYLTRKVDSLVHELIVRMWTGKQKMRSDRIYGGKGT